MALSPGEKQAQQHTRYSCGDHTQVELCKEVGPLRLDLTVPA